MTDQTNKTIKVCGSCALWDRAGPSEFKQCLWSRPAMPFWALVDRGGDHADMTSPDDGRGCKAWEALKND